MSETMISNHPVETARFTLPAREALTDAMVERIATTGAAALELLDRFETSRQWQRPHRQPRGKNVVLSGQQEEWLRRLCGERLGQRLEARPTAH